MRACRGASWPETSRWLELEKQSCSRKQGKGTSSHIPGQQRWPGRMPPPHRPTSALCCRQTSPQQHVLLTSQPVRQHRVSALVSTVLLLQAGEPVQVVSTALNSLSLAYLRLALSYLYASCKALCGCRLCPAGRMQRPAQRDRSDAPCTCESSGERRQQSVCLPCMTALHTRRCSVLYDKRLQHRQRTRWQVASQHKQASPLSRLRRLRSCRSGGRRMRSSSLRGFRRCH